MTIDSTLYAGLLQPNIRRFYAVQINFPFATLNLLSGSGFVQFPVNGVMTTFRNSDPTYGTLSDLDPFVDGTSKSTTTGKMTIMAPTKEAVTALNGPVQGSLVLEWFGLKNDMTGDVIGTPYLKGFYYINQPSIKYGTNTRNVNFSLITGDEWCFRTNENCNLTVNLQQALGYGDDGLKQVVQSTNDIIQWGGSSIDAPQGWVVSAGTTKIG